MENQPKEPFDPVLSIKMTPKDQHGNIIQGKAITVELNWGGVIVGMMILGALTTATASAVRHVMNVVSSADNVADHQGE